MLCRIDSEELTEWQAYYAIEPFGEERADLRSGIIASILSNVHRSKGANPSKPSDFVLEFGQKQDMSEDLLKAKLGILNGRDK